MKAILCERYGAPEDVFALRDVPKPVPAPNEVLVRVRAAALNPMDYHLAGGKWYLMRLVLGIRRPRSSRAGHDVAGEVEAVGSEVTGLKVGDAVFGTCRGAFAEYACGRESAVVVKPDGVTFEQAAAAPVAGLTALQAVRDQGRVRTGEKVLIHGAGGGVGTFAVQIAKALGAEVTGVTGPASVEMVRSIGADHVVDYTVEDFTRSGQRYDLIVDCYSTHSLADCRRPLAPTGRYVVVGGPLSSMGSVFGRWMKMSAASRRGGQKLAMMLARVKREDLSALAELMAAGKLTSVIDRRYALAEVPQALAYLQTTHARGKVVVSVA
jgi:NADPH:quinone reductase-like Zn-dependent oxidoreductase